MINKIKGMFLAGVTAVTTLVPVSAFAADSKLELSGSMATSQETFMFLVSGAIVGLLLFIADIFLQKFKGRKHQH